MGKMRYMQEQYRILEYKVTCLENDCDWSLTTNITKDLTDETSDHRAWHYDNSPVGIAKAKKEQEKEEERVRKWKEYLARKAKEHRKISIEIETLREAYENKRKVYETYIHLESLRDATKLDMVNLQEEIRVLSARKEWI